MSLILLFAKNTLWVAYAKQGDFSVYENTFEVGGKSKTDQQIKNTPNTYIAADGIEVGHKNKIPLWLFGFLY